jgi:bacterioferritin
MAEKKSAAVQVSKTLMDKLNQAVAREIQVAIQYMWQHVQWGGVKGYAVKDAFQTIAVQEMKHAEKIAERLYYLGGIPTTKPTPIFVGTTLKEMLEQDVKDEVNAITLYKEIIALALKEKDDTTNHLFRDILEEEEDHHDTFTTLLEDQD